MRTFSHTIRDEAGIHARPAGLLGQEARAFSSDIRISCGEKTGDAKGIFSVMGLGIKCGQTITVTIEGTDEEQAAQHLQRFFEERL